MAVEVRFFTSARIGQGNTEAAQVFQVGVYEAMVASLFPYCLIWIDDFLLSSRFAMIVCETWENYSRESWSSNSIWRNYSRKDRLVCVSCGERKICKDGVWFHDAYLKEFTESPRSETSQRFRHYPKAINGSRSTISGCARSVALLQRFLKFSQEQVGSAEASECARITLYGSV